MSAIIFFGGTYCLITLIYACEIYGSETFLNNEVASFKDSTIFNEQLNVDLDFAITLTLSKDEMKAEVTKEAEEAANEAVNQYLDEKAEIIKSELIYAVENYDDSYYSEYATDYFYDSEGALLESSSEKTYETSDSTETADENSNDKYSVYYEVPEDAPTSVKLAAKVLNTVSGQDLISYSFLVRESAFSESSFDYDVTITSDHLDVSITETLSLDDFTYTESTA